MPQLGKMRMYTSGCPNIHNRCCESNGSAPASTLKNCALKTRLNINRNSATVMTGMAKTSRNCTTSTIHVKIGIFINVMPGARMLRTVTIRLSALVNEAIPVICRPSDQKSTPCVGENKALALGWYMNQPPSAAPPSNHDELRNSPPKRKHQKPNA